LPAKIASCKRTCAFSLGEPALLDRFAALIAQVDLPARHASGAPIAPRLIIAA
jgi:hypothetical protein